MVEVRKLEYANSKMKELGPILNVPREVELLIWSELMVAYEHGAIDTTKKENKE